MKIRWNSRFASHLVAATLVIMLLLLGWRMSPNVAWFPSVDTEPLFEPEELPSLRGVISPPDAEEPAKTLSSPFEVEPPAVASEPAPVIGPVELPQIQPEPRDLEAERLYESWIRARQLLRQRDLDGAEQAYRDLTRRWPKHPDLAGELGNVYVVLGERKSAQIVFSRAQELLRPMGPSLQLEAVTRWLERHP